jgi:carboxymethylenebutenolidase
LRQVGVTGYCMGGALSIASAVLVPEVDAVVAFYGVPSPELADPSETKAPIQAHFGELDNFVGFSDVTVCLFSLNKYFLCCYFCANKSPKER